MKLRFIRWLKWALRLNLIAASTSSDSIMLLDETDLVQREILHSGHYEPETLGLVCRLLEKATTFLDVGAHVGLYTVEAAKVLRNRGAVIAVEPNPRSLWFLLENIRINKLDNVIPIQGVASQSNSFVEMHIPPEGNWGICRQAANDLGWGRQYLTDTLRLSDLLDHLGKTVDVVKMDIEGNECAALRGLLDNGRYHPHHIIWEYLPKEFPGSDEAARYLQGHGYELRDIRGHSFRLGSEPYEHNVWACADISLTK
jgi:FkbM family methyltransferase